MGNGWLEQIAGVIVLTVIGVGGLVINWLIGQKKQLQKRIETAAQNRIHAEVLDELKKKSPDLSSLVDTVNERLRREQKDE